MSLFGELFVMLGRMIWFALRPFFRFVSVRWSEATEAIPEETAVSCPQCRSALQVPLSWLVRGLLRLGAGLRAITALLTLGLVVHSVMSGELLACLRSASLHSIAHLPGPLWAAWLGGVLVLSLLAHLVYARERRHAPWRAQGLCDCVPVRRTQR